MTRRSKTVLDPQTLERIRAARAAEDAAIDDVFRHVALVDAIQSRRTQSLRRLDTEIRSAEDELAGARAALVAVAGLTRAASVLGVSPAALRKLLPRDTQRDESARPGDDQSA